MLSSKATNVITLLVVHGKQYEEGITCIHGRNRASADLHTDSIHVLESVTIDILLVSQS